MGRRILLVEDDGSVTRLWRGNLSRRGYQVSVARWDDASKSAQKLKPDIAVVDVSLPPQDCLSRCQHLCRQFGIPVLLLTDGAAPNSAEEGVEFVHTPLRVDSLVQRIDQALSCANVKGGGEFLQVGELSLDMARQTVTKRGQKHPLSPKLCQLLHTFMTHAGQVLSRRQLMNEIWDTDYLGDTRTLYVHIRWLRECIEDDPHSPLYLRTVRGVGYRFDTPERG